MKALKVCNKYGYKGLLPKNGCIYNQLRYGGGHMSPFELGNVGIHNNGHHGPRIDTDDSVWLQHPPVGWSKREWYWWGQYHKFATKFIGTFGGCWLIRRIYLMRDELFGREAMGAYIDPYFP
mmetsp:Transcript_51224/g.62672  ORF Transcript_51224/g.62672 Transcript_51224/m.62672 type:complete len:122 (+) Transcript_51224:49-414(+)